MAGAVIGVWIARRQPAILSRLARTVARWTGRGERRRIASASSKFTSTRFFGGPRHVWRRRSSGKPSFTSPRWPKYSWCSACCRLAADHAARRVRARNRRPLDRRRVQVHPVSSGRRRGGHRPRRARPRPRSGDRRRARVGASRANPDSERGRSGAAGGATSAARLTRRRIGLTTLESEPRSRRPRRQLHPATRDRGERARRDRERRPRRRAPTSTGRCALVDVAALGATPGRVDDRRWRCRDRFRARARSSGRRRRWRSPPATGDRAPTRSPPAGSYRGSGITPPTVVPTPTTKSGIRRSCASSIDLATSPLQA